MRLSPPKHKHELPTQEALTHGVYVEEHMTATAGGPKRMRRLDGSELDRVLFAKWITVDEHVTLSRFKQELYKAGLVFCPRAGTEVAGATGQGQFIGDQAFQRARRTQTQMISLGKAMSSVDLSMLLDVLTMDAPLVKAKADILKDAVVVLDKLYGRVK